MQSRAIHRLIAGILLVLLTACATSTRNTDSGAGYYRVKRGDTMYSIAWRYGLDHKDLARWNGIGAPYTIHPGESLRLNPPRGQSAAASASKPSSTRATRPAARPKAPVATAPKSAPRPPPPASSKLSWQWPTEGRVVSPYSASASGKKGIDIAGREGQPVKASSGGEVVYSGGGLRGYGQLIIINHNKNYLSAYAHNRKLLVKEGDRVRSGQQIAELGSTGTDRPKLHFEIRYKGRPVDPLRYLPRR